ncbi:hypothetical protein [Pigmentiphaga kullae]|uniref:Type II secretion system protein GspC N-terminal domain-containing protein n=1 Tax=Pigmentiphaga kullae TaxID=151784 RepID=A0A4Q7N7Z3_9BURK|nr:hypothetical protein [Pigmentiphaga kullae]RZS78074.1 hypothetical protein EV675_4715 [Pigmentiphaga kullae]
MAHTTSVIRIDEFEQHDMHSSLTERKPWPWWLLATIVAVLAGMWWQPWRDDPTEPAAALLPDSAPMCAPDTAESAAPIRASTSSPAPAFKLEGTVVGGSSSFAMVRHTTDSRLLQLRVGDRVEDLVVTGIETDRVVLTGMGGPVVIETWPQAAAAPADAEPLPPAGAAAAPPLLPIEQLPEAYRGPAPGNEVEGH